MVARLVLVEGDVVALGGGWCVSAGREELEVLDEAGLGRAHEGGEATTRVLRGAIVEDALLEREGGAHEDGLRRGGRAPRDEGLVVLGDVEDVRLEAALVDVGRGRERAHPVPVAEPVGGLLRLGVPGLGGVYLRWNVGVLGKTRYSGNMSLTQAGALTFMKNQLNNAAGVSFSEERQDYFSVFSREADCGLGVTVGIRTIRVIIEQRDVMPLVHGRMNIPRPYLKLRVAGRSIRVQKMCNRYGDFMVRYTQPLTEDGATMCVRLILAVFEEAARN